MNNVSQVSKQNLGGRRLVDGQGTVDHHQHSALVREHALDQQQKHRRQLDLHPPTRKLHPPHVNKMSQNDKTRVYFTEQKVKLNDGAQEILDNITYALHIGKEFLYTDNDWSGTNEESGESGKTRSLPYSSVIALD
jgi:hypothetical protein